MLQSVQPFVYENDADRYIFNKTTNGSLLNGNFPYGAPGVNHDILITQNSTYPNNRHWGGFNFISGTSEQDETFNDFAYGLYKLTPYTIVNDNIIKLGGYFYLDMRDSYYPHIFGYDHYGSNDFFFKYNCYDQSFKTSKFIEPTNPSGFNVPITENELITIWELADINAPDNSLFPNQFWTDCLVILTAGNNNPKLVWGQYPGSTVSGYKIYRASSISPVGKPFTLTFNLAATVSASTFDWIDSDIQFNSNGDFIYYYVKGYYSSSGFTPPSNIVDINGYFYKQNFDKPNLSAKLLNFSISQNYPNPFNPTTTITYSVPKKSNVSLKVYNTIGQLVITLVEGIKEKGKYEVQFEAKDIPSGVYLYTITAGNNKKTNKMLLLK